MSADPTFAEVAESLGMTTPSKLALDHIDAAHGYTRKALRELRFAKRMAETGRAAKLAERLEALMAEAEALAEEIHDLT